VNQVTVTGDVRRPGSYQVSSVGGLFNALYQAGGPTADGSFRHIEVHRGGELYHVADLYDFLVRGDGASDIRLEHNDRIFVPPAGAQARVEGAVRRPAIYEVKPDEGIRDLLLFAGGPRSDAMLRRVQIDRIVPPAEQRPGYYRTLVDVQLADLTGAGPSARIADGDVVTVFTVSDLRRNRVWLEGEVHNPGLYEWHAGATLWSVLNRADGLSDEAYTSRAHLYRLNQSDGSRRLIQVSLEKDEAGRALHDLPLADNDSIVVLSNRELRTEEFVSIDGFVKEPDVYPLARGMTLRDLILAAGGFAHGAYVLEAEVSRQTDPTRRTDTTAYVFRVPLPSAGSNGTPIREGDVPHWLPEAAELVLQHGDRVFVRAAPGYEPVREVHVSGQVLAPGAYVLATRDERVVDVIRRAGGLTPQAYANGIRVVRDGQVVAADLGRALRNPRDENNLLLVAGDSIHVPVYDAMVAVTGAVNFEARVLYAEGKGLDYYIDQAGGFTDDADRNRTTVTYANGERSAVSRRVFFGRHVPRVEPGSQVFVPSKSDRQGANLDQVFGRVSAVIGAIATAIIAYSQLK
jgi:protein involved in polysaccharide export with SLBB domain